MAAHARLKNEFTEDEKCHNLMSWLILLLANALSSLKWMDYITDHLSRFYNFYKPIIRFFALYKTLELDIDNVKTLSICDLQHLINPTVTSH